MKAIIIAAGRGSRLNRENHAGPKTLTRIAGQTIIEIILSTLKQVGVQEIAMVCGYKKEELQSHLGNGHQFGLGITYIFNPDWEMSNGVSVWAARDFLDTTEPFLLLMSDHLFDREIADRILRASISPGQLLLAVDPHPESVFDIDDAMKVQVDWGQGRHKIKAIGKELHEYNGIDCGIFKADYSLFEALERSFAEEGFALSDACRSLIDQDAFVAADIGHAFWVDIDTPESLAFAQKYLEKE